MYFLILLLNCRPDLLAIEIYNVFLALSLLKNLRKRPSVLHFGGFSSSHLRYKRKRVTLLGNGLTAYDRKMSTIK